MGRWHLDPRVSRTLSAVSMMRERLLSSSLFAIAHLHSSQTQVRYRERTTSTRPLRRRLGGGQGAHVPTHDPCRRGGSARLSCGRHRKDRGRHLRHPCGLQSPLSCFPVQSHVADGGRLTVADSVQARALAPAEPGHDDDKPEHEEAQSGEHDVVDTGRVGREGAADSGGVGAGGPAVRDDGERGYEYPGWSLGKLCSAPSRMRMSVKSMYGRAVSLLGCYEVLSGFVPLC